MTRASEEAAGMPPVAHAMRTVERAHTKKRQSERAQAKMDKTKLRERISYRGQIKNDQEVGSQMKITTLTTCTLYAPVHATPAVIPKLYRRVPLPIVGANAARQNARQLVKPSAGKSAP